MERGRLSQASYYSHLAISKLEALFAMMQEDDMATAASLYTIVLRMKIASGELVDALENGTAPQGSLQSRASHLLVSHCLRSTLCFPSPYFELFNLPGNVKHQL